MDPLLIYPSLEQPSPGKEVDKPYAGRGENYLSLTLI
jgi:hypothetical protein